MKFYFSLSQKMEPAIVVEEYSGSLTGTINGHTINIRVLKARRNTYYIVDFSCSPLFEMAKFVYKYPYVNPSIRKYMDLIKHYNGSKCDTILILPDLRTGEMTYNFSSSPIYSEIGQVETIYFNEICSINVRLPDMYEEFISKYFHIKT